MAAELTVWADIRCSWCWMGHRRLGAALGVTGRETVERRSFLLEPAGPDIPGLPIRQVALTSWGMSEPAWDAARERIRAAAVRDGLTIDADRLRAVDSRPVHRLLKLATLVGVDPYRAWDRAYSALLAEHRDVSDDAVLRDLGLELGIDGPELDLMLSSVRFADEIAADHRAAVDRGIRGVPAVVDGDRMLTGSHTVDELTAFLTPAAVAR